MLNVNHAIVQLGSCWDDLYLLIYRNGLAASWVWWDVQGVRGVRGLVGGWVGGRDSSDLIGKSKINSTLLKHIDFTCIFSGIIYQTVLEHFRHTFVFQMSRVPMIFFLYSSRFSLNYLVVPESIIMGLGSP